jgi:hypothetical protein
MILKTVSGSDTIVSESALVHKESISKVTAAASAQASTFCFHRAIEIKLSHLIRILECLEGLLLYKIVGYDGLPF